MSTTKKKDLNSLGDIYGNILNDVKKNIIRESKVKEEIGEAPLVKGGPQETAGYVASKIDRKKMSKKELEDNLYNIKNLSQPDCSCDENEEDEEEITEESRKIAQKSLNKFMSKKSIFDTLYENVMFGGEQDEAQELDSLGLDDATPDEEMGSEDEVTIKLDRETAMKLYEVLGAIVAEEGADEGEGEGEDEMGGEDEFGGSDLEEDEESLGGATAASKTVDHGKNNKVGNLKPVGGSASSASTDKVGNDGDHGHALVNAKQPDMGKNNKVGNLKTGQGAFQR
jgi:hypothetical protein